MGSSERLDATRGRAATAGTPMEEPAGDRGARFWSDLYWFVVITLAAAIVASLVLPPRTAETIDLLRRERRIARQIEELTERERVLAAALAAIQNDPIYREGVLRNAYNLRRANEESLIPGGTRAPRPITWRRGR